MARISKGILGGIIGSISGITGIRRHGKDIILKKPDRSNIVPTQAQLDVQATFFLMTAFGKSVLDLILKVYAFGVPEDVSIWNWFCADAYQFWNTETINAKNSMQLSSGSLPVTIIYDSIVDLEDSSIQLFWNPALPPSSEYNQNTTNILIFNVNRNEFFYILGFSQRGDGTNVFNFPSDWEPTEIVLVYMWFFSDLDDFDASPTINFTVVL